MEEPSGTLPMFMILQGGGLFISGGDVTITNCDIYQNTADNVSACYLNLLWTFLHRPHGGNFQEPSLYFYLFVCVLYHVPLFHYINAGRGKCILTELSLNLPPLPQWRNFPRTFLYSYLLVCVLCHVPLFTTSTGSKCLLSEPSLNFPPSPRWRKFPRSLPPWGNFADNSHSHDSTGRRSQHWRWTCHSDEMQYI